VTTATFAVMLAEPFRVTKPGLAVRVDCAGVPLQLNTTFCANPLRGDTVNV
jgi:hypothetical protein